MRKLQYLMNDFVVQEHVCNLRCAYCLNFENENLKGDSPWAPLRKVDFDLRGNGWKRAHETLARTREAGNAPILRIAGGEVMALPGSVDFIQAEAPNWERVQLLTNATFLERDIGRLAGIASLNLCCSLDGHNPELNQDRTRDPRLARRIVAGFLATVDAGVPVEIYTVLTQRTIVGLHDFANWVFELPRKADVRLHPFPARGAAGERMRPLPDQHEPLRRVLEDYDRLSAVLPPRAFLERLLEFCTSGVRRFRCRVPLMFLQTFDDGVVASCSNCWVSPLGNLLETDDVLDQVGEAKIHRLFLQDPPRFPFCRTCFTPFDVVSVYLDGLCTLDEIGAMDLYSSSGVRRRLEALQNSLWSGGAKGLWE